MSRISLMEGGTCWKRIHMSCNGSLCPGQQGTPAPLQVRRMGQKAAQVQPWTPAEVPPFTVLCSSVNSRQRKGQEDGARADGEHGAHG